MDLPPRQHRALCSICDTFLPRAPGWPSAVERGVPDGLAAALDFNRRAVDRWEFLNLLDVWDSSLHSFIEVGHWSQFSELADENKHKVMLSWADSRLTLRRAAFQALRKAVGFLYVMLPGAAAEVNPVWENIGYPGPIAGRRHCGELLHIVSNAGRNSRRVGGARCRMDSRTAVHKEYGRRVRAALREHFTQSRFETRTGVGARADTPGLACRCHAAQRHWL